MKLSRRDSWLLVIIIIVLLSLSIIAGLQQSASDEQVALSSKSSAPDGTKALFLWLEQLGYEVQNHIASGEFTISNDVDAFLVLQPLTQYSIQDAEWEIIDDWINAGGTLILAGNNYATHQAFQHFDFSFVILDEPVELQPVYSPLLVSPPMSSPITARISTALVSSQADFLTLVAGAQGPITVTFDQGKGRVILSTAIYPFSNMGLKELGNPSYMLNLFSFIEGKETIAFDEWHHGNRDIQNDIIGPLDWLSRTAIGKAILFSAGVIFIGIALSGKQFGKSVPIRKEASRRSQLEYISAVANLRRRAKHRQYTLMTYYKNIKRELGKRYRLDPELEDEDYISRLAVYNPSLDAAALKELLTKLRQQDVSEATLVKLAEEAAEWLDYYKR